MRMTDLISLRKDGGCGCGEAVGVNGGSGTKCWNRTRVIILRIDGKSYFDGVRNIEC